MKKIKAKKLTKDNFERYGTFTDLLHPESPLFVKGEPRYYPDLAFVDLGKDTNCALSVGLEEKREENIIEFAEIHRHTGEGLIPLNGDVFIYCAPPTKGEKVPFDYIDAFYVPKGTAITLRKGVWHGCQFPVSDKNVNTLVMVPERAYANDYYSHVFKEEEKIIIEL